MATVLVTGGSGFIASHTIVQLLAAGHAVRTTVRKLSREPEVRALLREGKATNLDRLQFFAADLESDEGWSDAANGSDYVLHLASPFPPVQPRDENDLIRPARDGALRVLRAARDAGVKRVVLTSSFAAIGYGHPKRAKPFDENDWTDLGATGLTPYVKSKTIAERAAWDFIAKEGGKLQLAVVNPVAVLGPVLGPEIASSVRIVKAMLEGAMPGVPALYFGIVDVRDVADLHIRAMTDPAANGERFLAVAGQGVSLREISQVLRGRLGAAGAKAPQRQVPNWLVRLTAVFKPAARQALPELGKTKRMSNAKACSTLAWVPRSGEEAIVAAAESLIKLKLVKGLPSP